MDRRTDDGEFNSPPSSLREAGDKNSLPCLRNSKIKIAYRYSFDTLFHLGLSKSTM